MFWSYIDRSIHIFSFWFEENNFRFAAEIKINERQKLKRQNRKFKEAQKLPFQKNMFCF
jgi:hypothetical protein